MTWKAVGIIFVVIAFLAGLGAVVYKITSSTETYKAKEQTYYTFEPHQTFFGCANYKAENYRAEKKPVPMNKTK